MPISPKVSLITVSDAIPERVKFHHSLALSVASQNNVEIEWLWNMIDSKATEEAFDKVQEFVEGSRIVMKKVSGGETVGQRRNIALKESTGDFIAGIDDDDVLYRSNVLFESIKPMLENEEILWTASPIHDMIDLEFSDWEGQLPSGVHNIDEKLVHLLTSTPAPVSIHPTTIVSRKEIENEYGGWDENLAQAEDIARALKLASIGHGKMEMLDKIGWLYRKHNHSMMANPEVLRKDAEIINNLYQKYNVNKPFPQSFSIVS